nr:unknown [Vitreoscilla sp. C1]
MHFNDTKGYSYERSNFRFFTTKSGGLIQAEDGKRYLFRASEWQHTNDPSAGQVVEFVAADEKFAIQVHPILTIKKPSPEPTQKFNLHTQRLAQPQPHPMPSAYGNMQ